MKANKKIWTSAGTTFTPKPPAPWVVCAVLPDGTLEIDAYSLEAAEREAKAQRALNRIVEIVPGVSLLKVAN
jgi:hypothetical protein